MKFTSEEITDFLNEVRKNGIVKVRDNGDVFLDCQCENPMRTLRVFIADLGEGEYLLGCDNCVDPWHYPHRLYVHDFVHQQYRKRRLPRPNAASPIPPNLFARTERADL